MKTQIVATSHLLTREQEARLGEVFLTDIPALIAQRDACWKLAFEGENYPGWSGQSGHGHMLNWLGHYSIVQTALDCWSGAQL